MKQVCLLCERTAPDNNLYCQETYCPAEMSPTILGFGEWLGDIEIVRPVIVLRSAVLYEAMHQKQKVFLKVAHPGAENKERLKREAEFLKKIQLAKKPNPLLPTLLPPYANTTIAADAYGKTMLNGHLLYFYLFEHFTGESLRDILIKNSQLWINHIGWLMIDLARAVAFLHSHGLYHFGLSPECLLVRFDDNPNVPRILLFDLGVVNETPSINLNDYSYFVLPAYTAPELINAKVIRLDYATDVYGLGLILYELLVGEPAYTYKLQSDEEVYQAIQRNQRVVMNRIEDVKTVANIALQAVTPPMTQRQPNATEFAKQLLDHFGHTPPTKKSPWPSLRTIMVIVAALLAIAFLLAMAVSARNFFM
jgi:serine/threonine protein kinase